MAQNVGASKTLNRQGHGQTSCDQAKAISVDAPTWQFWKDVESRVLEVIESCFWIGLEIVYDENLQDCDDSFAILLQPDSDSFL